MIDKTNNQQVITELERIVDLQKHIATEQEKLDIELEQLKSEFNAKKSELNDKCLDKLREFAEMEIKKKSISKPKLPKTMELIAPTRYLISKSFVCDEHFLINLYITVFSGFALLATTLFWIIMMVVGAKWFIPFLLFVASAILWFTKGCKFQEKADSFRTLNQLYNERIEDWKPEFEKIDIEAENNRFLCEFREYDKQFLEYAKTCDDYFEQEQQNFSDEVGALAKEYDEAYKEKRKDCDALIKELSEVTLISPDYIHLAGNILKNLQSDRADNLKEALNIAFDDERRDKEEAARRAEAAARQAAIEYHNFKMERAAREEAEATARHNAAMERAVQDQARAEELQARAAEQQAKAATQQREDMARAASRRCSACANSLTCSFAAMNAAKATGYCAAFRPR
ncbi:MAG: hypothetical protein J6L96_00635 [Clostridia bacterium]|nr:hypothetical protein [Clostridia bacterium]